MVKFDSEPGIRFQMIIFCMAKFGSPNKETPFEWALTSTNSAMESHEVYFRASAPVTLLAIILEDNIVQA